MQRYWQQVQVKELGLQGQQLLAQAKVLVVGVGGLGTPLASYLVGAGIGTVGLADGDKVAISNLHRQLLFNETDIGQPKAIVLAENLKAQNPSVLVNAHAEMLDEANSISIISQYDIICDCTDTATARLLIDAACTALQKPVVYATVRDWIGYITILHYRRRIKLEQLFSLDMLRENSSQNCSVSGIINSTCAIAAGLQTTEVFKIICNLSSELDGGILCFDTRGPFFRLLKLNNKEDGLNEVK